VQSCARGLRSRLPRQGRWGGGPKTPPQRGGETPFFFFFPSWSSRSSANGPAQATRRRRWQITLGGPGVTSVEINRGACGALRPAGAGAKTTGADAWLKESLVLVGAAGGLRAAGAVSCFFAPNRLDAGHARLIPPKSRNLINAPSDPRTDTGSVG